MNSHVTCKIHVNSRVIERSHVNWQIRPGQKNGVWFDHDNDKSVCWSSAGHFGGGVGDGSIVPCILW